MVSSLSNSTITKKKIGQCIKSRLLFQFISLLCIFEEFLFLVMMFTILSFSITCHNVAQSIYALLIISAMLPFWLVTTICVIVIHKYCHPCMAKNPYIGVFYLWFSKFCIFFKLWNIVKVIYYINLLDNTLECTYK